MSGLLPQHGEILLYDNGTDKQFVSVVFKDETLNTTLTNCLSAWCSRTKPFG